MKIYVALDVKPEKGNPSFEDIAGSLEDEIEMIQPEVGEDVADVEVIGMGATLEDLQESIDNRKANRPKLS